MPTESKNIGGRVYVSIAQVADRYRVALATVYNWDREGLMPQSKKLGRRRLWWLDELQAWEDAGFPEREPKTEQVES